MQRCVLVWVRESPSPLNVSDQITRMVCEPSRNEANHETVGRACSFVCGFAMARANASCATTIARSLLSVRHTVFGAVRHACPPTSFKEKMRRNLADIAREVDDGRHAVIVLDGSAGITPIILMSRRTLRCPAHGECQATDSRTRAFHRDGVFASRAVCA